MDPCPETLGQLRGWGVQGQAALGATSYNSLSLSPGCGGQELWPPCPALLTPCWTSSPVARTQMVSWFLLRSWWGGSRGGAHVEGAAAAAFSAPTSEDQHVGLICL